MDIKLGKNGVTDDAYKKQVKENMVAIWLIKVKNIKRYENILTNIRNQLAFGIDDYIKP